MSEIEDTFTRISNRPNVGGIIVVNSDGIPQRSTIDDPNIQNQYAHLITALAAIPALALAVKLREPIEALAAENPEPESAIEAESG